ncbi:type II secretion system F family protein [Glaciecola siphonariae]|uniref:Type II secretion system F family protein n=1 Tax=Glaciecola siphonariae TaxID=521012 RepID=A0ABV9LW52_9ALTE
MKFKYVGVDKVSGQKTQGEMLAFSKLEVHRKLSEQRIEVISINDASVSTFKRRKVKSADLVVPLRELATLLSSGVTLIEAIYALAKNDEHPNLGEGFALIAQKIEGGLSFSKAVEESSLPFAQYVAQLIKAGELSGKLALSLEKTATQMEYEQQIKSDLKAALTYPMILILSGLAAMLIIFFAVVPQFSYLLDNGNDLPALAYFVLSTGKLVNDSPLLVLGTLIGCVFFIVLVFANPNVRTWLLDKALHLPVVGPWLNEQDAAKWASLTASMLIAKVNLSAALLLSANSSGFTQRRARAQLMVKDIEDGMTFHEAMTRANLLPPTSLNLIAVGDKTGQLAEMLSAVANLHDQSYKRKMKQVLTLMEPIAILVVGIMLGIMILGIVMAITASTDIPI